MKKSVQSFYFLLLTFFVFAGVAGEVNKERCEEWCMQQGYHCSKCSKFVNCGPGYSSIASFRLGSNHWHACIGIETNKRACNEWCDQNKPNCVKCSTKIGCGPGFERMMGFTGPEGLNWHACKKTSYRQSSEGNKAECRAWCAAHSPCVKCDTRKYCGPGHKPMKHFTGSGTNWHACKKK